MNKIAVIYKSKYGSTKTYAEWIAEELEVDIYDRDDIKAKDLSQYETIIYGGGLYAGGINGISLLTKNVDIVKDKNLIVFTCGLADVTKIENIDNIKKTAYKTFGEELKDKIKLFHLRGAMDYGELTFVHRKMMGLLNKKVLKMDKESLTEEEKDFLETYGKKVDFKDKSSVCPLIEYVRNI